MVLAGGVAGGKKKIEKKANWPKFWGDLEKKKTKRGRLGGTSLWGVQSKPFFSF